MPVKAFFIAVFFAVTLLLQASLGQAAQSLTENRIPAELDSSIALLLGMAGPRSQGSFKPEQIAPVLDFITADKDDSLLYYPDEIESTTAAYHEFELAVSLERVLRYAYNSAIPAQAFSPSSLRNANFLEDAASQSTAWKWRLPAVDREPQIVRIAEHEEITPDLFTGAYYAYNVDRTLALCRYQGRNFFLSLARQRGASEVGRKGTALGSPADWDFLYSGQPGLTATGLGWVDSYMYNSFSITVFYETGETGGQGSRLRCGVFKWLNAGWAGINMVQRQHIHRGLERYAGDFKQTIENQGLPGADRLAADFAALGQLNETELRDYLSEYLAALARQYSDSQALADELFGGLVQNGNYLNTMTRSQMLAAIELEYLKALLGKTCKLPRLVQDIPRLAERAGSQGKSGQAVAQSKKGRDGSIF